MKKQKDQQFRISMKTLLGEGNPVWQDDDEFIRLYNEVEDMSLVSPYRCFNLYQFAQNANSLHGQFAQVGIYKGGSARLISRVKSKFKKFYLFDTFSGLPKHNFKIDDYTKGKFSDTNLSAIKKLFAKDRTVQIFKGIFPKTGKEIEKEKIAFVYIDVDLYKSNFDALEFFYKRMVPGGIMIFDDYGWRYCEGIKKSIEDFIKKYKIQERPIVTTKYQCVIIKS
ncbi:MAG: TylF/MycF/NovP-related O-methyltransferase [Candidatus Magasanikbacteria bacterium]